MTKQVKFILAVVLQVGIIFAIILFKLSVLTSGTDVYLRITPVDPRDVLRGDYVTFQYDISNLDKYYAHGQLFKNGETFYVVLENGGKYWQARDIRKYPPTDLGTTYLKGVIQSGGEDSPSNLLDNSGASRYRIQYGIEQYFIPEGAGQNFSFWGKDAAALVKVDDKGNAVLKQIYVDNKPWP